VSGTVYLVGAGPGAPDLLTVRAVRLLGEAEIVFHDALVSPGILALIQGEKVAVGKRCGRHSTAQRFINKRLADAVRRHRVVVRLKGGDPMLFGRAHEEISFLIENQIPVEIVPGVTAALAASAAAKVSLTRRGVSRSVLFATPRLGEGEAPSAWVDAVRAADTAVLYMAARDAVLIRNELLARGMPRNTPVAVAESVSFPEQKLFIGDLEELPQLAARCTGGPALLLIGEVFRQPPGRIAAEPVLEVLDLIARSASHRA
jgi:uroporphyrin-III C-methyltransferase